MPSDNHSDASQDQEQKNTDIIKTLRTKTAGKKGLIMKKIQQRL